MNTPLSFRLISFYATVATVTAFVTLWVGEMIVERQMLSGTDLMLDAEFAEIDILLAEAGTPRTAEEVEAAMRDHTLIDAAIFFFQVSDTNGNVLFRSRNLVGETIPLAGATDKYSVTLANLRIRAHGGEGVPIRVGDYDSGPLRLKIASSLTAQRSVRRQFHTLMAAAVPSVFLLSLAIGYFLSQVMLKPLRVMQQTAQRIGANNLKERIPVPDSRDEITHLAELLNNTFDRLEKSFEQIRQFTADSSHELKTPLSIIRLQAEKVLEAPDLAGPHRVAMSELLGEVTRLEKVINQLLLLARAESAAHQLDRQSLSVAEYVGQFGEDAEALAESEGRRFRLVTNETGQVDFDPSWMRQVLFNLLSNAIKYSPPDGEIRLSSRLGDASWELTIEDAGPGVPADQLTAIFGRFNKVPNDPLAGQGTGLGLAVCKSIVELHGGTIRALAKSADRGFCVEINLPIGGG